MLLHIFYSLGILFLIRNISSIYNFQRYHNIKEWHLIYSDVIGKPPKDTDFRDKKELDIYQTHLVLDIFEFFWILFGLLTVNINTFIMLLVFFVFVKIFSNSFKFTIFDKILSILFILIRFCVYLLLIFNHFIGQ
jgi:hypothetical protein